MDEDEDEEYEVEQYEGPSGKHLVDEAWLATRPNLVVGQWATEEEANAMHQRHEREQRQERWRKRLETLGPE